MNRVIKFRTWNKRTKVMDYNPDYNSISEKINNSFGYDKDIIEMQYTGLKDKNGKQIYEGDFTQYGRVIFDNYMFCIELPPKDGMRQVEPIAKYMSDLEVIGNIYENPELLKP